MSISTRSPRTLGVLAAIALVLSVAATSGRADTPSGTVEIDSTQLAFIISGNLGKGTLHFQGKSHTFSLGGLGIGGVGIAKLKATGEVYKLDKLSDFAGTYLQVRAGATLGEGKAVLSLSNQNGVEMNLKATTEGLALQIGADGLVVNLE